MKSKKWVVHAVANCMDCDKHWDYYKTARKNAYNHAKKTGHHVEGEIGMAFTYKSN